MLLERSRAIAWITTLVLAVLAVAVGVDHLVRWPWPLRCAILMVGLVGVVNVVRRAVLRTWFSAPSIQSVAVRIEHIEPRLQGTLASAVDFQQAGVDATNTMARQVVVHAEQLWNQTQPQRRLRQAPALRICALGVVALIAWCAMLVWQPIDTSIGLRRTLTPWSNDQWPARVGIESSFTKQSIARGAAIPLRVRVVRGDQPSLRVQAMCLIKNAQGESTERELDLVRQADGVFERPVTAEGEQMQIQFIARDAQSEPVTLSIVTPPTIVGGTLHITSPAYASNDHPPLHTSWQGLLIPEIGSVLGGSQVQMQLQLAAPAQPPLNDAGAIDSTWLQSVVRINAMTGAVLPTPTLTTQDAQHWTLVWQAQESMEVQIDPRDAHGVQAPESLRLSLRVTIDREPTVLVTEPESDETITPQAVIPFTIEASDDLGLASIGWRVDRQQRSGEPAPTQLSNSHRASSLREDLIKERLSAPALKARSGDVLLLRGVTNDRFESQTTPRIAMLSEPRQLRVVDREVFERQVRQQTSALRQAVARLESAQQEIARTPDTTTASRAQSGLSERVHQANTSANRLVQRLIRNQLQELSLTETLHETARLGDQAELQSTRAQDQLRKASAGDAASAQQARTSQAQAEQLLREMVDLLDRDNDTAGAQRRADRLAENIAKLRSELKEASRSTAGKSIEELTASEQHALQEQATQQRAAADEVRAMLDDLHARAEKVQSKDRAQARSLRQAADEGDKGQAPRHMDEASERTERNQTTAADESMQAAAEAVQRVRDALREDKRARTEDLRRKLASVAESLQALILSADSAVKAVDAIVGEPPAPSEPVVINLLRIARNSAAISQEAQEGDKITRLVAKTIDRATDRFEASVTALRAPPISTDKAHDALSRGADILREALKEVQTIQKKESEKSTERERADLAKMYQQLATQVRSVRELTITSLPPTGAPMDRRATASQREQSIRLQTITQNFRNGPKAARILKDAATFQAAHERIDKNLTTCSALLQDAKADNRTIRKLDITADTLESLALALTDPEQGEDPFADDNNNKAEDGEGGGGGGGDENNLPPIAELRLVRHMQAQVNKLTTTLDTAHTAGQVVHDEMSDLGAMQDEVRRLGEDWIQRMKKRNDKKSIEQKLQQETTPVDGFMHSIIAVDDTSPIAEASSQSPPVNQPATATTTPPSQASTPKTLDELLGLDSAKGEETSAQAQRDRKLNKALKKENLNDLATSATESMQLATMLVADKKETGVGTQRVQAEALANLDALIDSATQFQKQQKQQKQSKPKSLSSQSKPKKKGKPGGDKQEQASAEEPKPQAAGDKQKQASEKRNSDSTNGEQVEPPPPDDATAAASGVLEEGRSEWGGLPQRIREIMSQARRDRISAIYQQATEAYYRRMAEERAP